MNTERDRLIASHTEVAKRIALKMARRCPSWIAREDIVAAGMLGLIEAASRYDHTRAEPFLPFAEQRIRGAVLDELRRGDLLPRRVRQLARKISQAIRSLESAGDSPTDERVARLLGVSEETYRSDMAHLVNVDVQSMDGEGAPVLVAEEVSVIDQAQHRQVLSQVRTALEHMEPRDVSLLSMHYLEDKTFQQIATELKITPSRACQLLWRAVERLRAHLGERVMQEAA